MFVGIGVGIGRQRFMGSFSDAYVARVTANGGIVESIQCVAAASTLLQSASLLLIPSGFKEDVLYAENPVNGNGDLTWTRASDAWRTNASGLVQRTPWNLLQQSETFNVSPWATSAATVTANAILAPNGTLTADKIIATAVSSNHFITYSSVVQTGQFTFSVFAKSSEYSTLILQDLYAGLYTCRYNLSLGTATGTGASIENMGDGWYKCIVTYTSNGSTVSNGFIGSPTTSINYTGDGTSGIYVWGAQLVEGSSAQTYFPTTDRLNVPRLDYMYGSCPAVLLEPQRTNLALYSAGINVSGTWLRTNISAVTSGITSPEGTATAFEVVESSDATAQTHELDQVGFAVVSGTTYTYSVFIKAGTNNRNLRLAVGGANFSGSPIAFFSPANGTVVSNTDCTASIESYGNGWFRCRMTATADVTGTSFFSIVLSLGTTINYIGNGSGSVQVWGAQVEAGAYPTTYIATTTSASATRVADAFTRNNIYTNGLISSSGGTWFVELRGNVVMLRDTSDVGLFIGSSSNGVTGDCLIIRNNGSNTRLVVNKRIAGSQTSLYTTTTDTVKIAIKWDGSTADIFVNGTKVVSATAFAATNMEFFNGTGADVPKYIQAMALFPTPLSDAECITLTT